MWPCVPNSSLKQYTKTTMIVCPIEDLKAGKCINLHKTIITIRKPVHMLPTVSGDILDVTRQKSLNFCIYIFLSIYTNN